MPGMPRSKSHYKLYLLSINNQEKARADGISFLSTLEKKKHKNAARFYLLATEDGTDLSGFKISFTCRAGDAIISHTQQRKVCKLSYVNVEFF